MFSEEDAVQIIWDYLNYRTPVGPSDAILVLGNSDIRTAHYAVDLYLQSLAPILIFSGGHSSFTAQIFQKSEAESFAAVARKRGVPESSIIIEEKSTNTQENFQFTQTLLRKKNLSPKNLILVQKPNMLRRVYATARKLIPEVEVAVASHGISWREAPHEHVPMHHFLHELTGDLQRIKVYAEKGFIIPQEMEPRVWQAYLQMVNFGYTGNLVEL